jgi:nucleotide-binding universal stress UspA family protein
MKVLPVIDGSKFSDSATEAVIARARSKDTDVRVLHVVEPTSLLGVANMGGYDSTLELAWEEETKQSQVPVARTAEKLRSSGLVVSTSVQQRDAKSTIIDIAREWHADLIVLGSYGRNALSRFLMGSVSEAIVCQARCSVEIVRIPSGANAVIRTNKSSESERESPCKGAGHADEKLQSGANREVAAEL